MKNETLGFSVGGEKEKKKDELILLANSQSVTPTGLMYKLSRF